MPIIVVCPGCNSRLNAPDAVAGKTVKCPKCKAPMVIPEAVASLEADEPTPLPKKPASKTSSVKLDVILDDEDEEDEKPRAKKKPRDDDDDAEEDHFRKKGKKAKKGSPAVLIVAIVSGVLLLCCGGPTLGIYWFISNSREKVREVTDRSNDSNNLKQMAVGFHSYANGHNDNLPNVSWGSKVVDGRETGNLSWRVAILPYVEQDSLYRQFKLDEPWDSENNKKLIPKMPKIYASPLATAESGKTYYKVFVGNGAIFNRPFNNYTIGNIPDGTSNTLLIASGGEPVIWSKPDDFEFDPKKPLQSLVLPGKSGFNVALADGSTRHFKDVSEQTLKSAIQADDGKELGADW